ncbi:MAG: hypothetical protein JSV36_02460, partial [Anaerolineae bacterium]
MKHLTIKVSVALTLGLSLALALLWLLGSEAFSLVHAQGPDGHDTYYVAPSCAGLPDPCYTTVQDAVDAADDPGDVIKVAAGTYTGVRGRPVPADYPSPPASGIVTQAVYISKTVSIRGGYTTAFSDPPDPEANRTTLDAQGQGRVLYITGNISPTVEGLRITGGYVKDSGGGGGIY